MLDTYDEQELMIWAAYDEVIGLDDLHYDLSLLATIQANQFSKRKFKLNDFLKREQLFEGTWNAQNFNLETYKHQWNAFAKAFNANATVKDK